MATTSDAREVDHLRRRVRLYLLWWREFREERSTASEAPPPTTRLAVDVEGRR